MAPSRLLCVLTLCFVLLTPPNSARAASGAYLYGEVLKIRNCPGIIAVGEKDGYSILRPVAGPAVVEQDVLSGNLETIGLVTVNDVTRGNAQLSVIVEDILLSESAFRAHLARFCR